MSLMPLLCFHLGPQSLVLFRFVFRQSMLLKTQTDPLTGRDRDIIQIWKGHHHFARGHIRRSPAGFIIFNVQLAKKKKEKKKENTKIMHKLRCDCGSVLLAESFLHITEGC